MQLAGEAVPSQPFATASIPEVHRSSAGFAPNAVQGHTPQRRGRWRSSRARFRVAMTKAFLAVSGGQGAASARVRELVSQLTDGVVGALDPPAAGRRHVPHRGHPGPGRARADALGRARHRRAPTCSTARSGRKRARRKRRRRRTAAAQPVLHVVENGERRPLDLARLKALVESACAGLGEAVRPEAILQETLKNLYDGVPMDEVRKSTILSARALIEKDPAYRYVTARLLLHTIRLEVLGEEVVAGRHVDAVRGLFPAVHQARDPGRSPRRAARRASICSSSVPRWMPTAT